MRVGGTLEINGGFTSGRTFRFVGPAPRLELLGTALFNGTLTGSGFELDGTSATLRLTGTGSLSGPIDVMAGVTLQADGTHSVPVTLQSTASLIGTGSVGNVTAKSGSAVLPGVNNTGILTVGDITFESGSSLVIAIGGTTAGTNYDQLVANSAVIQSNVALQTSRPYTPASGDSFTILTNVSSGAFDGVPGGGAYDLNGFNTYTRYDGGTGDDHDADRR